MLTLDPRRAGRNAPIRARAPRTLSLIASTGLVAASLAAGALGPAAGAVGGGRAHRSPAVRPPAVSTGSFHDHFAVMRRFRKLAAAGTGKVAVLLPDTVSSTRYVESDQPDITKALTTAGMKPSQFVVQNALGSDATQLADARADVANGTSVLVVDPLDSTVGSQIEADARTHGVKVIDYDRLTLGGSRAFFVGFDDVLAGRIMGKGLARCVKAWHVAKPQVVVMHGAVTDTNATLFARGYDRALKPYFTSGRWTLVARTAGTWDPPTAAAEFQAVDTAHPGTNAALVPNDETASPIVTFLQAQHVKPKTFPLTGQDATLTGLQNVLAGYQCGTVYKPVYLEAQAAVALALFLRAGVRPPTTLVNGTTVDATAKVQVPSVLMTPTWVTTKNMRRTVIEDGYVPAAQLCTGPSTTECRAAGITP